MKKDTTEPAFPMLDPNGSYTQYGLTKREYFAGLAMQGLLANPAINSIHDSCGIDWIAEHSITQADELLKRLEL